MCSNRRGLDSGCIISLCFQTFKHFHDSWLLACFGKGMVFILRVQGGEWFSSPDTDLETVGVPCFSWGDGTGRSNFGKWISSLHWSWAVVLWQLGWMLSDWLPEIWAESTLGPVPVKSQLAFTRQARPDPDLIFFFDLILYNLLPKGPKMLKMILGLPQFICPS